MAITGLAKTVGIATTIPLGPSVGSGVAIWGPNFGGESPKNDEFFANCAVALGTLTATWSLLGAAALTFNVAATYALNTVGIDLSELGYSASFNDGANSAVNDGPDNWTNSNNATGLNDGTNATRAGQLVASTDANLRLNYVNPSGGLETFTLTGVFLDYYTSQTGTTLNNGGLIHEYRLAVGAWTTLETFTGNITNAPKTYDITAAVGGDWTKINALEVRVRAILEIGTNLVTVSCDAVQLRFTATKTTVP